MNLLEHEAKNLLAKSGIPTPKSTVISNPSDLKNVTFPAVLKSQVPTGGRGKAGGIVIASTAGELASSVAKLFELPIKNHLPTALLAEEKLAIKTELYLSLLINRKTAEIQLIAHTNGGVEVESNKDFASWPVDYSKPDYDALGQSLADYYDLQDQTFALQDLVQNLVTCFKSNDATLIEINPLIVTQEGELVAGDCKMTLDDAASFRHPDWNFSAGTTESNFVTINEDGNVATIANGAGLAMATVDAAYNAGLTPANFLDIGGGANKDSLLQAFERIMTYKNVQAIIINVFAGITRADEVAKAVIAAKKDIKNLPPLFIRLSGTNDVSAHKLLEKEKIATLPNLTACLKAAKQSLESPTKESVNV